jgi:hypothetical protein
MSGISMPRRWAMRECPNSWSSTQPKSAHYHGDGGECPDQIARSVVSDEGEVEQEQEESPVDPYVYSERAPYLEGPASHDGPFRPLEFTSLMWHQRDGLS